MAAKLSAQELMEKKQKEATLDLGENFTKRNEVVAWETKARGRWADEKVFEVDSPSTEDPSLATLSGAELRKKYPKFFGTFPFPYMNGSLHLGHAFTVSKVEFAVGFERMLGRRVLFPVGWHATGMPIKAASDKLIREMEQFGDELERFYEVNGAEPNGAPVETLDAGAPKESGGTSSVTEAAGPKDPASVDKSKAKKGKIQAKSTGLQYQFQIMESIGVPRTEIKKFADPLYWLEYFPPIAKADLNAFGARVDWRRSLITTPANLFYDAFVRWQMNRLYEKGHIKFGERYTIYSPKDGQPCMDHDRASGERMGPQEYTAIKMKVIEWGPHADEVKAKVAGKDVYFVAATLRSETTYGQTNCFVSPTITYGIFEAKDNQYFFCTDRAARNMAFQNVMPERGVFKKIADVKGSAVIGTKVNAPNSPLQAIYLLPMESILASKGTGVVTSAPSDSPDDYVNLMYLKKKAAFFNLDPAWVACDPIPVLSTEEYGEMIAPKLVEIFKIDSPKDAAKLAEAKEVAYRVGYYQGKMSVSNYEGEPVEKAKNKIREELIARGEAFAYAEPEGEIISRSADVCVVALCDQWYLDYGESVWQAKALKLLDMMNIRDPATKKKFEEDLDWLHQWACARSYGLGSKLPWDPQFLVESLSDSTIYMSYYTIAHLLHGDGDHFGRKLGPLGITPDQMTDEVWDYVFGPEGTAKLPESSPLPKEKADALRREFLYFYPMDLRSSGKDLISNHLSFCLYVHTALFEEQHWPRTMRANGHLMLNGKKMSKSTGNSLTLRDSLEKFGADATRITLADSGDSFDDANFEELTANATILRLHTFSVWAREVLADKSLRTGEYNLFDKIFEAEINAGITKTREAFENSMYKEATKYGLYELLAARDWYRDFTANESSMHAGLLKYYIRIQALLVTPIAPHFAEHVWSDILGEKETVQRAQFPEPLTSVDAGYIDAAEYIKMTVRNIRTTEISLAKRKGKGKAQGIPFDPSKPRGCRIFVSKEFPEWQDKCIEIVRDNFDGSSGKVDDKAVRAGLEKAGLFKDKRTMPFIQTLKGYLAQGGTKALNRTLKFDETDILHRALPYFTRTLGYDSLKLETAEEGLAKAKELESSASPDPSYNVPIIELAEPGSPGLVVYNT